ncbi:hypothetical protein [Daejeonella sp. H1SJ63]|uniref:hypothetical protein n=1 Tax=Daejeonella sp. H1SJ63 TaxID=3034145 RepID=UPI0023EB94B8|nr:hypothetical protein [Daejeonella sp. H1SJ63]
MKPDLTLIIERQFFDQIVAGTKTEEYRSLSDYYINRFCVFEGERFTAMKPIKVICFAVGYAKDRPLALVEVKGIFIDTFEDHIPEGFNKGDQCFTIELGKVLKTKN